MVNQTFWNNKKVLITGHTGFKGGWLAFWLHHLGAKVIGYALKPPTQPNLFEILKLEQNITSIIANIQDKALLTTTLQNYQPEIIFHLAAQPLVRYSYKNPLETFETNILGTAYLLETLKTIDSVTNIIIVTSDKCYQNQAWFWGYREDEALGGYDPYSASKACAEIITTAYRNSFFNQGNIKIATARAGNVIGGGDWAEDRLIPDIIKAAITKQKVIIRNPHAIRPWQHVLEPLTGYLLLAEQNANEAFNFGPNEQDAKEVAFIIEQITTLWSEDIFWDINTFAQPHEAQYLKLDSSKAKVKLGWQPQWNIDIALTETIAWYQAYYKKHNMLEFTLQQIQKFNKNHR